MLRWTYAAQNWVWEKNWLICYRFDEKLILQKIIFCFKDSCGLRATEYTTFQERKFKLKQV